jgi:hypothetical protein
MEITNADPAAGLRRSLDRFKIGDIEKGSYRRVYATLLAKSPLDEFP